MLITVQILKHLRRLINQHKRPLKHTGAVLLFVPLLHFAVVRPEVKDQVIQSYQQDVTQASQELKTLKQQHTTTKKQLEVKTATVKAQAKKIATLKTKGVGSASPEWAGGYNGYVNCQCTAYAKKRRPDLPNNLGNAKYWFAGAKAQGYEVGLIPKLGAIAVSFGGWAGHVAYVEKVHSDGSVTISEWNYQGPCILTKRHTPATDWNGYIYK